MDAKKTGQLIRSLRRDLGMTQLTLAEKLGVSDKAVSKWERGAGSPDISLLPSLSAALGADMEALLRGDMAEKSRSSGDMRRLQICLCPVCGHLLFSTDGADMR